MNKFLFLDLDGVLIFHNTFSQEKALFVQEIINQTDVKIILSSSWRFDESMIEMLENYFPIASVTPQLEKQPRRQEIKSWLKSNCENFEKAVILDDQPDAMLHHSKILPIQTDSAFGLTNEQALTIIEFLNHD